MEPQFSLPFRTPDGSSPHSWPAKSTIPPNIFANLSPSGQQSFQAQQQTRPLRSIQPHPQIQYGRFQQAQTAPSDLPYDVQQTFPIPQVYSMIQSSPTSMATSSGSRALPLPSHILPSQNGLREPCMACGKTECSLSSHKHFTKHVMSNARKVPGPADITPRATPAIPTRPAPGVSIAPHMIVMDAEQERLLALWSTEWSPVRRSPERHLFPSRFIDRVLPAAKSHPPLLQALLAYSGTIWAMANNVLSDVGSRQHSFAVQLLSQACPTEQEAGTDEGMLAATFLLLVYMAQGNGFEVGKHVSGLVHLAKLRGGPHYLGMSGLVAETLIYADHMQAIFFNHEPVWTLPLPPLNIGLPQRLGRGFRKAVANRELDMELGTAAESVCKVTDVFEYGSCNRPLPTEIRNGFGYLATISEYQLARCNAAYHQTCSTNECVCLALILFGIIVLRNDGAVTPIILQVEYRFWQTLEAVEGKRLTLNMSPCLYMWMVITGLTVAIRSDSQYRINGVEKLRAVRIGAGVNTWDQLRVNVLEEFLWLASAQEDMFRRIWIEVEGLKSAGPMVNRANGGLMTTVG